MSRFRFSILTLAAATLIATGARAAEIDIPPPIPPKELPVHVNQPNCMRWTDSCVNCTRGENGAAPTCSNIGFACQPQAVRCTGFDAPRKK